MPEIPTEFPDREPSDQPSINERLSPTPPTIGERLNPTAEAAHQRRRTEAARHRLAELGPAEDNADFTPGRFIPVISPDGQVENNWRVDSQDEQHPELITLRQYNKDAEGRQQPTEHTWRISARELIRMKDEISRPTRPLPGTAGEQPPISARDRTEQAAARTMGLIPGQQVSVERSKQSGGCIDPGWRIESIAGGEAVVIKQEGKQTLQKKVPLGPLADLQHQQSSAKKAGLLQRLLGRE
jgi:hypothetical protein